MDTVFKLGLGYSAKVGSSEVGKDTGHGVNRLMPTEAPDLEACDGSPGGARTRSNLVLDGRVLHRMVLEVAARDANCDVVIQVKTDSLYLRYG